MSEPAKPLSRLPNATARGWVALLSALESQLCDYTKARYFPREAQHRDFGPADVRFFASGVAELSAAFTMERSERAKNYFNQKTFRSGYLLYFVLSNFPKAWHALTLTNAVARFAKRTTVRVLDLGSGPGTASLAALEYWKMHAPTQPLDVTAIDQNGDILKDAASLWQPRAAPHQQLHTHTSDLQRGLHPALCTQSFDIVFAMNLFNEIANAEQRTRLLQQLLTRVLAPGGICIVIDPGLRQSTRALMELRGDILADPQLAWSGERASYRIAFPCLHHAECPMLRQSARDWCHVYLRWQRPKIIAALDRLIENDKEHLIYSQLILERAPFARAAAAPAALAAQTYRVVSAPLRSKGKTEILLCAATTNTADPRLVRALRLDKYRSPANADLDSATRGDIICTESPTRLGTTDVLRIVSRYFG